ncbi:MAG: PEP-CTERM sorting domain-containing protein, partial [Phycisphaerales bacterium]|nr:PEP-CTERM sorting domain-containing protein [Phycisphaerales bacterium]
MGRKLVRLAAFLVLTSCALLEAADNAYDAASNSAYTGGWSNGSNGGFGFGAWSLSPASNTGNAGFFIASSTENGDGDSNGDGDINTAGNAFGLYGNSGQTASAVRSFNGGALTIGQSFYIRMDNGFIDTGGTVGLGLQNSSGTNRIEFYFSGGDSTYRVNPVISSPIATGVNFTDEGLRLQFTVESSTQVRVIVRNNSGASTLFNQLVTVASATDISRFRLFNANAGSGPARNLYFNEMAVPEPGGLLPLALGVGWLLSGRRRAVSRGDGRN